MIRRGKRNPRPTLIRHAKMVDPRDAGAGVNFVIPTKNNVANILIKWLWEKHISG